MNKKQAIRSVKKKISQIYDLLDEIQTILNDTNPDVYKRAMTWIKQIDTLLEDRYNSRPIVVISASDTLEDLELTLK
jgi:predicted AAA+ superfamily ATPase